MPDPSNPSNPSTPAYAHTPTVLEANSLVHNPQFEANGWRFSDHQSPLIGAGTPVSGLAGGVDSRGVRRHATAPTIGAFEYTRETVTYNGAGRVASRTLLDRTLAYAYNGRGQLTGFSDSANPHNNASYTYDAFHRRVGMRIGTDIHYTTVRMIYQGDDVVEDLYDYNGDGIVDRRRVYMLLPGVDQRLGFIDLVPGHAPKAYYYVLDHVGSILRIVDEAGTVVNQYDYDAFGNINWDSSFEGIDNRYTFQGREYDKHAGHYYYRFRTYIPEWGTFTGLDMHIRVDHYGPGTYVFCNNNPWTWIDPEGDAPTVAIGAVAGLVSGIGYGYYRFIKGDYVGWKDIAKYAATGAATGAAAGSAVAIAPTVNSAILYAYTYAGNLAIAAKVAGAWGVINAVLEWGTFVLDPVQALEDNMRFAGSHPAALLMPFDDIATLASISRRARFKPTLGNFMSGGTRSGTRGGTRGRSKDLFFDTERQALRRAKRDAGIPTSETHIGIEKNVSTDRLNGTGDELYFKDGKTIQHHKTGHDFPVDPKPQHFNNHPHTKNHYIYEK